MVTNWAAIDEIIKKKAEPKIREKVDKMMLGIEHNPSVPSLIDAGNHLAKIISEEIESADLTAGQKSAIPKFTCGTPHKLSNNRYAVLISNDKRPSPSLVPEKYGYIDDLTMLFNDGVDHVMNPVFGYWQGHGIEIMSRTHFPNTHFLENAQQIFIRNFGSRYHIIECELNR